LNNFWPDLFQLRISAVHWQGVLGSYTAVRDKAGRTFLQRLNCFDTPTINHCTAWIAGCTTVDQSLSEFKTASHILLPDVEGSVHETPMSCSQNRALPSDHRHVVRHVLSEIKQAAVITRGKNRVNISYLRRFESVEY